ncbi:MAG TPA: VanW family protein, partial [Candidatus Limnocylindrales bacterium]
AVSEAAQAAGDPPAGLPAPSQDSAATPTQDAPPDVPEPLAAMLESQAADPSPAAVPAVELSEPVPPVPAEAVLPSPAPRRRARRVGLFFASFVLGLAVVLTAAGAGLAAWDSGYEARVLPGVHVGGVDLSGLDRASAAAALRAAFPYDQGRLVLRTPTGDLTVPFGAFSRHANVDALVDAAFASGRGGDLATRVMSQVGQAIHGVTFAPPSVVIDQQALANAVRTALAPLRTSPVDATIAMTKTGIVKTAARLGTAVDPAPVIAAAEAAVGSADAPAEVVVPVATTPIPPTVGDIAVDTAAHLAQQAVGPITITFGKKTWTIRASAVQTWLGFATADDGSIRPTVDTTKIPASLTNAAKAVLKPATSAVFLRAKSGKIVGVAASADGRKLDVGATSQRIADAVLGRMFGGTAAPVKVATAPQPPKLTTEQAKLKAPVLTLLGTWTTWFPINDHNFFGANIWIPAQLINGTMLAPGQTFDWWNAIGDVSPARGFGPGGVIQGNHTDPTGAMGGGMCSSSTTLFNAALRAGLQMGARGNHRYYINRYPLGLDATVWKMGGAVQDMSFTNDTPGSLLILGIKTRSGGTGFVTYQIWGIPDGRTVSLSGPMVSNVIQATTNTQYVTTLPHGVRQQTEYPSNQMDVAVTRVVRKAGQVLHSDVWYSHYVLWNGIIQIGQ